MTQSLNPTTLPPAFPDRTQLPDSDSNFAKNFQEHPQSILLTDSLETTLQTLHPDGQYAIGMCFFSYWYQIKLKHQVCQEFCSLADLIFNLKIFLQDI